MIHGLIVGILAGLLAGKFMGRQNDGCIWNFFLGLFGGFIGGWLFDLVGIQWEAGWIGEIGTADYLVGVLSSTIPAFIVPSLIFVLGALISFATGTSYGTMSILMPLAIPLAWAISSGDMSFTIVATSGVLTGAIFGDHCSPISDTTILSSMGTSCNHIDHVTTQMYYSMFVGAITILVGYIPAGLGVPFYFSLPVGIVAMFIGLKLLGEKVDFEEVEETSS